MRSHSVIAGLTLMLMTVALAGCSGGDDGDGTTTTSGTSTPTGTTTTTTTPPPGTNTTPPPAPIYINGTAMGLLDCTLNGLAGVSLTPSAESVPAEASGRPYTITFEPGTSPLGTACIAWDTGGSAGNTGTVPHGATEFTVYVDLASDLSYSMLIE